jgi:hypothetical protein
VCSLYYDEKRANDGYYFLRKNIKDKILYVLIDFSIPIKEKLLSCLVLYPKLYYLVRGIFMFIKNTYKGNNLDP